MSDLAAHDADALLWYAVAAIRSGLEQRPVPGIRVPESRPLNDLGAAFVTLERDGRLLGCIGTLRAVRPLYEDAMANAYKSAFSDPRLPAVTRDDFAAMDVKVSVLAPMTPVAASSRRALIDSLQPGIDGLLLTADGFRATFLPAVWDRVSSGDEFVDQLLHKGGLNGTWLPGLQAFRYTTVEYAQCGPRHPITVLP